MTGPRAAGMISTSQGQRRRDHTFRKNPNVMRDGSYIAHQGEHECSRRIRQIAAALIYDHSGLHVPREARGAFESQEAITQRQRAARFRRFEERRKKRGLGPEARPAHIREKAMLSGLLRRAA